MIEINLLPPEYRPRDKTNLPLIFTITAGVLLVLGIFGYYWNLTDQLSKKKTEEAELTKKKADLTRQKKEIDVLKTKIDAAKARQETIVDISLSKIMWSLKLQQLSQIMNDFPRFWIKQISLAKGRSGSQIELTASATGSNLAEVGRFRKVLKNDPNFFYHFTDLNDPVVRTARIAGDYNFKRRMDFTLRMPLKTGGGGTKKKKKGRR